MILRSHFRFSFVASLMLLLAACGVHNTISDGGDSKLMLKGHDPVAYFTIGKHTPGRADIKAEHGGVTYRFASAESRDLFVRDPKKYEPQYHGFCANGIVYAVPAGGDPDTWEIINGKLYVFGGPNSKKYFMSERDKNVALADGYWSNEMKDMWSATWQRYKRTLFARHNHYKTNRELEAEWQAKQGKSS
jgi:YHS domain-containing protein